MDTSTFSLQEAYQIIQPRLDHLSFRRMRDYVSEKTDRIEGQHCTFQFWKGRIQVPYDFSSASLVYKIPVSRRVETFPAGNEVRRVIYDDLLLQRTDSGGTVGYWYLLHSVFAPSSKEAVHFNLQQAQVLAVDDENFYQVAHVPGDFRKKFWDCFQEWVEESIKVRQKAITSLKKLADSKSQPAQR